MWTFFLFSKVEKINVASMDMAQSKKTDVTFWEICVKEQREIVKFMLRNMTQKITGYHYFANCQDAALNWNVYVNAAATWECTFIFDSH